MTTINTPEELAALPRGTVVHSARGTIACRWSDLFGVCFGAAGTFPWNELALPLTVLYRPDQPVTAAPTCQPSREAVADEIISKWRGAYGQVGWQYNSADAVLARLPGRPEAEVKAEALEEAATPEVSEWARKLIEDELVEMRDSGIGMLGRRNGLVIYAKEDGHPSSIIRLGFEMAWKQCLTTRAAALRGEQ